ncbi:MAG: Gfo/Idh/MocA family oxidoreductase [Candidatus Cloacimonetes bacterium]|nr:Gfo/Idh/MocA family oxidoreductase [Candidatus Cloacimonadota bacterium]
MIKVGVIGVGQFGQNHARILKNGNFCDYQGHFDIDPKRSLDITNQIGSTGFPDYSSLLHAVDAMVIVVTTISHYEVAEKALQAGKHVFIEKPVTAELWQGEKLVELAARKNLQIQVGHIERFNPIVMEFADKISNPLFIECHRIAPFTPRGSDVPVVIELMIHDLDLILAFVKGDVIDIRASGAGIMTRSIDIANARLEFDSGCVANVTASRISQKRSRKLRFFQKDAYFSMDFQNKKVIYIKKSPGFYKVLPKILKGDYDGIKQSDVADITEVDASHYKKDALTVELESFVNAVETGIKPVVDGIAGTRALKIALRIVEKIMKK